MKRVLFAAALLALLVSALVLAGCGEKKVPAGAIAAVGSGVVTQEQFDQIWQQAQAQYKSQQGAPAFPKEGTAQYDQLKASIVNYLVLNEVIAERAADMDVKVTDKQISERMKQIVQQVGGQKKLDKLLKQQGVTAQQLEVQLKAQMLQEALQQKVISDVKVSDAKLKAYFDDPANKAQFQQAATAEARHVLVKTKAEADKVYALLSADPSDANWKKVAAQYSSDPGSKDKGGSVGTFSKGQMVPPFDKAAFSAKLDTVLKPVQSSFGWHVIEVQKRAPAKNKTFAESKSQIQQTLLYTAQSTAWQDWVKKAMKDAGIVYAAGFDPDTLTASPSPAATGGTSGSASPSAQ